LQQTHEVTTMTDTLLADLRALATHNGSPVNPENLRWAATHESLCRSWIFDVLMGMADLIDKHAPEPDVSERDELAQAAAWVAEALGYPVETSTPDAPMPDGLWEALVDHVHADKSGRWHGNELDRDEVAAWLAEEAGRKR